ncbi:MAG: serine hydrolase, partial [Bacteroidota bacterium]
KMEHTHYCSNAEVVKNKVYGYNYTPGGLQQKPYIDHTWPYAAGSLCSSVGDQYIWSEALHNGKVFKNDLYRQMITPGALNNGAKLSYAMGLVNFMNYGHREISHGGGIHGFLSHSCYYPDEDLHIICLTNSAGPNGGNYFTERVAFELMEKKEYQAVTMDIDTKSLEGNYKGEVRGSELSAKMEAIPEGFTVQYNGEGTPDTLSLYVGNNTWMDGNTTVVVKDGECRVNEVYGYYILKKE